jgi:hypothetical protein
MSKHGPLEPGADIVDIAWKVYLSTTGDQAGMNAFHAAAHVIAGYLGELDPSDVVASEAERICRECREYERALKTDAPRSTRDRN